jgi:hypothetical protein
MMAGTYEAVHEKVELERMLELYSVTEEFSRSSAVCPAPINIPVHLSESTMDYLSLLSWEVREGGREGEAERGREGDGKG